MGNDVEKKVFRCDQCIKTFGTTGGLLKHKKIHTKMKRKRGSAYTRFISGYTVLSILLQLFSSKYRRVRRVAASAARIA